MTATLEMPRALFVPGPSYCVPFCGPFSGRDVFVPDNAVGIPITSLTREAAAYLHAIEFSGHVHEAEIEVCTVTGGTSSEMLFRDMGGQADMQVHPGHLIGYLKKMAEKDRSRATGCAPYRVNFLVDALIRPAFGLNVCSGPDGYALAAYPLLGSLTWMEHERLARYKPPS